MLINVFGNWVNPDKITYIFENEDNETTIYVGKEQGFTIKNSDLDEVANEINKQLRS